jgi:23S rRNA (guanosine2251-2'-O)-methyltransferase
VKEPPVRETVFGVHPIREILRHGARTAHGLVTSRPKKDVLIREVLDLARDRGVAVGFVTRQEIERRFPGENHQGIGLEVDALTTLDLDDALGTIAVDQQTIWVALDEITDPHNLGAIIRSAASFGATAVLTTERRSAGVTPLVQKIASGATEYVGVVVVGNLGQAIQRLKAQGFWIYGAALEGDPLPAVRFAGPALLVIGAEGRGLRKSVRAAADRLVAIPKAEGGVASLNASCATAVLLYELRRHLG